MDQVLDSTVSHRPGMSRRKFLALAGVSAGLVAGGSKVIDFLNTPSKVEVNQNVLSEIKANDLELGELGKTRSEYFALWPYSRIWVVVNNLIASQKLDGMELEEGKEYSLINLLQLDNNYDNNFNPNAGYIAGVLSRRFPPFIYPAEAQGLSLTATCFARAASLSPVKIVEWNTHPNNDIPNYFNPDLQFTTHPQFQSPSTDATVYSSNNFRLDFKFTPLTNLKLRYKIMDTKGRGLTLPGLLEAVKQYPRSAFVKGTTPILLRVAFGSATDTNHQVNFTNFVSDEYDGRKRPGFVRELVMGEKVVSKEKIQALYDTNGTYMP